MKTREMALIAGSLYTLRKIYIYIYGERERGHTAQFWDLSPLTRDRTHAPCIASVESSPLDHLGSPKLPLVSAENPREAFNLELIFPYYSGLLRTQLMPCVLS